MIQKINLKRWNVVFLLAFFFNNNAFAQKRVTDFYTKDADSEIPSNLTEFAGKAYFLASDVTHGRNVWVSDGTANGSRFFLETEPNQSNFNQFLSFKTDSVLYIFSKQNLWQIDRKQQVKKLNTKPLFIARYVSPLENKLFFNALEYFDLTDKTFHKLDFVTPIKDDNLIYFSECSHDKLRAISLYSLPNEFKDKLFVLEPNQTQYTSLILSGVYGTISPNKIYNFGNEYFGTVPERGIYKFTKTQQPQLIISISDRVLHQYISKGILYLITIRGSQIIQYTFDGKTLDLIDSRGYNWNNITLNPLVGDSLFYADVQEGNFYSNQIVSLSKSGDLTSEVTLPKNLSYFEYKLKVQNDSLVSFINFVKDFRGNYDYSKAGTVSINLKNYNLIFQNINEPTLLPNGIFLGKKTKKVNLANTLSLYNETKSEFLIANVNKSRPTSLGMAVDLINKTLFMGVNEFDKGKSIYAFKPESEQGKLIFAQKDSLFSISTQITYSGGVQITDDILFYSGWSIPNFTQLIDYSFPSYFPSNAYVYDHQKNIVVNVPFQQAQLYTSSTTGKNYEVDANKIREVDFFYRNTLKTYNCPTEFDPNRIVQIYNQLYFLGAESSVYANQLFVFEMNEGTFKRIIDQPVEQIYSFKNQPVVLLKSGEVMILDSKNGYFPYHLFSIDWNGKDYVSFRGFNDFFTLNTEKYVYYSDGNCQNSGQVDVPLIKDDNWQIYRLFESDYYVLSKPNYTYIAKGKVANRLKYEFPAFRGITNKYVYYTVYVVNRDYANGGQYLLYQLNLSSSEPILVDIITSDYSTFKTLQKGKKWVLTFGNKQYIITDRNRDLDNVEISVLPPTYFSENIIFSKNKSTLLVNNSEIIWRTESGDKILFKSELNVYLTYRYLQSNEYAYVYALKDGRVRKIIRVNKQDFSIKLIDIPDGVRNFRTRSDTDYYYPIILVGDRLYGIVDSPNEGQQLWILDEIKQGNLLPFYQSSQNIIPEFVGNSECVQKPLNQTIPSEKVTEYGIFPNPTSKYLFLNLPKIERDDIQEIVIYNILGQTVGQQPNRSNFSTAPDLIGLDLPNLSAGSYFLKIQLSSKVLNFKFVVY